MSLLELLGFPPTLPGFAARLLRALASDQARDWSCDLERGLLTHPSGMEVSLSNMFVEYRASSFFSRSALIDKYAALALAQSQEIPALWITAAKNVIPVVRSEFVETTVEIKTRANGAEMDSVVLPLAGDLRVRLVYDFGQFMSYVKGEQLRTWGQSDEDVLQHALSNLGRLKTPEWVDSGRGFHQLASEESYAESMALLDSVVAKLPFATDALLMPCNRGVLLAADGRSEDAVSTMIAEAIRCSQEEPWPMSSTILCKHRNGQWTEFDPPASAADLAHKLFLQHRADFYAAQKDELDAFHERSGRDVFVANCSLIGTEQAWESYCVWSEGVESLLPVTDWVALVQADEEDKVLRVSWPDLVEVCRGRLQPTCESPPRFLVNSFPDSDEWGLLCSREIAK